MLLRTIGKYAGMIRRQATEFRAQFDEAMREAELDKIKEDVAALGRDAKSTFDDAGHSINRELASADASVNGSSPAPAAPLQVAPPSPPLSAAAAAAAAASPKIGD